MRLSILLTSLACSLVASAAFAEECDRNDQSQTGMDVCAGADYAASDAKLNAAYGEIVKRLADDEGTKKLLQASPRSARGSLSVMGNARFPRPASTVVQPIR